MDRFARRTQAHIRGNPPVAGESVGENPLFAHTERHQSESGGNIHF
jgi:hypothetical protein